MDHNKLWKILQEMRIWTTLPASCETCMQIKKKQLEADMEQWTGSKLGKGYVKAIYFHSTYLTYATYIMQNARLNEAQAEIQVGGRNINNLRCAIIPP